MVPQIPNDESWIHDPPEGRGPNPPVETNRQFLPLAELSWKDFERLCLRIARLDDRFDRWSLYGTEGQSQGGNDVVCETHGLLYTANDLGSPFA